VTWSDSRATCGLATPAEIELAGVLDHREDVLDLREDVPEEDRGRPWKHRPT